MTFGIPLVAFLVSAPSSGIAQATDAERTLSQLQTQAEASMAQGDPQGAAISIGQAALLASQLGNHPKSGPRPYRLMVDLFRTQEQVYRAIALFQQSGEQTPVSSGICSLLTQGKHHAARALQRNSTPEEEQVLNEPLHRQTTEWLETVQDLQREWDC